jgi:3-dehydroquinate synthase
LKTIRVHLAKQIDHSYDLKIGSGLLSQVGQDLKNNPIADRYALITDSEVAPIFGIPLLKDFQEKGLHAALITFPAGEEYKTRETKAYLEDEMFRQGFGRDSAIIALGGGVVGDIAGFVAATYNRGIPYIQIPTTLLAHVDSSIGGKTAVDVPWGKNLVGAFYQPVAVYIDIDTLKTLPPRQIKAGLAEIVKYAVIQDRSLFDYLQENQDKILNLESEPIIYIIGRCCEIKAYVVEQDEREGDLRKILNYGHTIGHAIEALCQYRILHGEGVAIGMTLESRIAQELGYLTEEEVCRQRSLLEAFGLPVTLPSHLNPQEIIQATTLDKKARGGKAEYVLPRKIGEMVTLNGRYGIRVDDEIVRKVLSSPK